MRFPIEFDSFEQAVAAYESAAYQKALAARYLDILYGGYEAPASEKFFQKILAIEHATLGLRRYVALIGDRPAAVGALFTNHEVSYFAGAATLLSFRRRGCQAALINRRLADAGEGSDYRD